MTEATPRERRPGLLVSWPVAFGFAALGIVAIAGVVRLADRSVALGAMVGEGSQIIEERTQMIEEQAVRIAHLQERLRILEAIEDLQTRLTPSQEARLARHVYEYSETYDIAPLLLLAIIQVESSFGTHAVSHMGARGLMQVKPSTGRWVVSQMGSEWPGDDRLFEPEFNLWLGTRYLSHLVRKFGSVEQAIIAYNWGETAVRKRLVNGQKLPRRYLRRVQTAYRELQSRYGSPASDFTDLQNMP